MPWLLVPELETERGMASTITTSGLQLELKALLYALCRLETALAIRLPASRHGLCKHRQGRTVASGIHVSRYTVGFPLRWSV